MAATLTPELILQAYSQGWFPMGTARDSDEIEWHQPHFRGILPLDERFHIPRSTAKALRRTPFTTTLNQAFGQVIDACATPKPIGPDRQSSWINTPIRNAYLELHRLGFAHSIECWQNNTLAGGIYGVAIHQAFFAESMFSHVPHASKAALIALVHHLRTQHYALLDIQYTTPHLEQFGAISLSHKAYMRRLHEALATPS